MSKHSKVDRLYAAYDLLARTGVWDVHCDYQAITLLQKIWLATACCNDLLLNGIAYVKSLIIFDFWASYPQLSTLRWRRLGNDCQRTSGPIVTRVWQMLILTREVKANSAEKPIAEECFIHKAVRAESDVRHDTAASSQDLWWDALQLIGLYIKRAWALYHARFIAGLEGLELSDAHAGLSTQLLER